jgi:cellobionic acid phosphorylase
MKQAGPWGGFSDDGKTYIISRLDTPRPWVNFLYGEDGEFQLEVSQRGEGVVWYHHKVNVASQGRNFCLRDAESGDCWSCNGGAAPQAAEEYCCKHGLGETRFRVGCDDIETELLIAADRREPLEIDRLVVRNRADRPRRLSLTAYHRVELSGPYKNDQIELTRFDKRIGAIACQRQHYLMPPFRYSAFWTADRPAQSYCGSWEDFLGSDVPESAAAGLQEGPLPGKHAYACTPVLALQYDLCLAPYAEERLDFAFGLANGLEEAFSLAAAFAAEGAQRRLDEHDAQFAALLQGPHLETGDEVIDHSFNVWTRLQLHRQVLSGRFGVKHNWRNNLQDVMGWLPFDAAQAGRRLKELCAVAEADGFMPRTSVKIKGLSTPNHQHHMDIATWAGLLAGRYAGETGDLDLFAEPVEKDCGDTTTVGQSLVDGMQWLLDHRGQHGMVLLWEGDWSDPLEEAGRRRIGESPWTSVALVNGIREFVPVLRRLGRDAAADRFEQGAAELTDAVNEHAWDGAWYIRGITDDGVRFCTADDPDANVSLMMQAWSIISGVVPSDRVDSVLQAAEEHCWPGEGPILYGPPFLKVREELGRETVKQPGTGENGSVYTHGGMMWAHAELKLDRPDQALRVFRQVMPMRAPDASAKTRSLPLWWPNYWQGPHADHTGRGSGILSTGAPAWFFYNIMEGFLGLRPTLDGLQVRPRLPKGWNRVALQRDWRGAPCRFAFERTDVPAATVTVNGAVLDQPVIPVPADHTPLEIRVAVPAE